MRQCAEQQTRERQGELLQAAQERAQAGAGAPLGRSHVVARQRGTRPRIVMRSLEWKAADGSFSIFFTLNLFPRQRLALLQFILRYLGVSQKQRYVVGYLKCWLGYLGSVSGPPLFWQRQINDAVVKVDMEFDWDFKS